MSINTDRIVWLQVVIIKTNTRAYSIGHGRCNIIKSSIFSSEKWQCSLEFTWKQTNLKFLASNIQLDYFITKESQKFYILVTFGSSRYFCHSHEGDERHWIVRCQACLILSKSYSLAWNTASESMVLGLFDLA